MDLRLHTTISSATMSARAGRNSDEVVLSQPLWDYLTAGQQRVVDFQAKHGLCVVRQSESPGCCTVRLCPSEGEGPVTTATRKAFVSLCRAVHKEMTKQVTPKRKRSLREALRRVSGRDEGGPRRSQRQKLRKEQATEFEEQPPSQESPSVTIEGEEEPSCSICMGEMVEKKTLDKCGHSFCKSCLERAFQVKRACPVCRLVYGQLVGNQPHNGRMIVERERDLELPGHEGYGCICIIYSFLPGVQGEEHPNPGVCYPGTDRVAYLPDSPEGNRALAMLRKAFDQRLIFTIGTSMTTGMSNVITWNDIHHKTCIWGGPRCFGYPDPTYLVRVMEELREKGVTAD
ncbi:putative E3 ubiquitin-protein ligase DTX3 isoform X1 [Acipenser oxyrinchus oxyrinchus]|uniref:E3 ubiquitin-protein ligase n=1 Tax=Acipenser oxyrinchus oxyrinchus TaxID=40147 RepID=A0AAD8CGZ5_ACIOX|nr:putative E3 ubiquitin-protein ligase DTX3 isoform X1 [Acipenser oxyrinchus oxyrinchus]KAK1151313.1 putative E3 ubiquitin-protein ligase DTX3 isoform X1 [Acipenser oxyrinchus oxyrinchus]